MLLIGQFDSPFVRRVAVALERYALPYEHRAWSVWGDADRLGEVNSLRRVPTLVLDDGTVLVETFAILDTLDEMVGPERALLPPSGAARREALRIMSFASGLADKAVSLLYERLFRKAPSTLWTERCQRQIADTLTLLETDLAARPGPYWLGERLTHADIATACTWRFACEAHPGLIDEARYVRLAALARSCEAMPEFSAVVQPITNVL